MGANGTNELRDEGEDLVVGRAPLELAVCVLDVAVEGRVCDVDQLGHGPLWFMAQCAVAKGTFHRLPHQVLATGETMAGLTGLVAA
jgi:hypothetical protein